jgi:D-3-phosphoglycerate dehydrogenase
LLGNSKIRKYNGDKLQKIKTQRVNMKEKRKVVIATASWHQDEVSMLEEAGAAVKIIPDKADELYRSEINSSDALIVGLPPVTRQLMENSPRLMIVARHGVGYDNVDMKAATELGIVATNTPGVNSDAVAEFTYGLLLAFIRQIPHSWELMRGGGWRKPQNLEAVDIRAKTLGIIGLGRIGSRVSKIGNAFGLKVLACDPYITEQDFKNAGAQRVSKEEAIRQADYLTLHTPLSAETREMIGAKELAMMKKSALLINTSRGEVVDEDALINAVNQGLIAGAALDVFKDEPPKDRKIATHPKILVTAHLAGLTKEAMYRTFIAAATQVIHALKGERPPYALNEPKNPRYLKKGV